ncbi:hypothetical protein GCM10010523_12120 [Paenarthrobacter ilicis]
MDLKGEASVGAVVLKPEALEVQRITHGDELHVLAVLIPGESRSPFIGPEYPALAPSIQPDLDAAV